MSRPRILFLSPQPFFQERGSPIRVKFNLLALVHAGYEVDLLTLPVGDDLPLDGVEIHRVANPFRIRQVPIGPNVSKLFFDLLLLLRGFRMCRSRSYEIIHGIEEAGTLAVLLAKTCGSRAVFEKHSDPYSYRAGPIKNVLLSLYARVETWTARRADAVIGTGGGLVEQVRETCPNAKAFHIPDIPSSTYVATDAEGQAVRDQLQAGPGEVLILYVGSFAVYQGVDLLFAALPEVLRTSASARVVIIGGNEEEIAHRREALQNAGVSDRVTFVGKVPPDQLPCWLAAADLMLSPRMSGVNTPLKVLDYFKAGRAVVATEVPANRGLLDEETAVFAEPNPAAFAKQILALVEDRSRRDRLGLAGRRRYEQEYTLEKHQERLATCYQSLTSTRSHPETESPSHD